MQEVELREKGSLARKILGTFKLNKASVQLSDTREDERAHLNIPADFISWNTIRPASLEAERNKIEAMLERQRCSFSW